MYTKNNVNLSKMNRIGVLTVAPDRISREDADSMTNESHSITKAFFERMKQCNHTSGKDCVLSMTYDKNLVLAHFDNNAIFLLSENPILSPTEFVNVMINLQNSSIEMRNLLRRKSISRFSDFYLGNLNINFVELALVTGMSADIVTACLPDETSIYPFVRTKFNSKLGIISHSYSSQYGTNLVNFLNRMIESNPDVRLLMSNVICRKSSVNLVQAMIDAIGFQRSPYDYTHGEGLSEEDLKEIAERSPFKSDEEFLKAFEKEKQYQIMRRTSNNEKYAVYPAFKHVVELRGKVQNMNEEYVMAWYDGDPDTGVLAINTSLNNMIKAEQIEDDSSFAAPRVIPEVKGYMQVLTSRAHTLSKCKRGGKKEKNIDENV